MNLLTTVQNVIQKWNLASSSSGNLLRIVISSFASPFWQANADSKEFLATLLVLKSIVRTANAVAIVTLPSQVLSVSHYKEHYRLLLIDTSLGTFYPPGKKFG